MAFYFFQNTKNSENNHPGPACFSFLSGLSMLMACNLSTGTKFPWCLKAETMASWHVSPRSNQSPLKTILWERERLVGWDGWKTRIYSPFPFSSCHSVHNCSTCVNCLGKRISLLCMQGFGSQFWWAGSKVLLCHIFMMGVLRFLYDLETFMVEEQMPTSIAFHHLF